MTSIPIAPIRNAGVLATQAATIDSLSNGRLTLGLAVGGREDDYLAGLAPFRNRGKRFDEMLTHMRAFGRAKRSRTTLILQVLHPSNRAAQRSSWTGHHLVIGILVYVAPDGSMTPPVVSILDYSEINRIDWRLPGQQTMVWFAWCRWRWLAGTIHRPLSR